MLLLLLMFLLLLLMLLLTILLVILKVVVGIVVAAADVVALVAVVRFCFGGVEIFVVDVMLVSVVIVGYLLQIKYEKLGIQI